MLRVLGSPRGNYDQECRPVTNGRIRNLIVTEDVGPFRVTGLKPVVEKLRAALADVKQKEPECYNALGSAGMLCTRYVRGSKTSISNHSWGCAIDFTLEGKLDTRGDDKAQKGLIRMHPIFNSHDFFWGAAFKTEDAMHFEISRQQMLKWNEEGVFGDPVALHEEARLVALGDRGPQVEWIQERLNLVLGLDVEEDGIFGAATRASVIQFQRHAGIRPDGVATNDTMEALRRASPQ
ncbi:peptidoglycan-binding protein [Rhizobium sp. RU36D]|uniref:peptidoglycan-binding protein n=1 Tax=Rhizobium sp. RU36D TaxID=1907415 RepID=UPI0015C476B5|nr:peptidoglycan-binding protein [Rhizobium sp. RU36D]